MAFDHSSLKWFEACSCKPAQSPATAGSSFAQLRAAIGELLYLCALVAQYVDDIGLDIFNAMRFTLCAMLNQ
jgi:hypothetical protein